jgi:hypothetical protein
MLAGEHDIAAFIRRQSHLLPSREAEVLEHGGWQNSDGAIAVFA